MGHVTITAPFGGHVPSLKSVHGCKLSVINSDSQCFWMVWTTQKFVPLPWGIWTWFLRHTQVSLQTESLLGQPFLQGSQMSPTQIDRPHYSICSNMPLSLAIAAMRPNKQIPQIFMKSGSSNSRINYTFLDRYTYTVYMTYYVFANVYTKFISRVKSRSQLM